VSEQDKKILALTDETEIYYQESRKFAAQAQRLKQQAKQNELVADRSKNNLVLVRKELEAMTVSLAGEKVRSSRKLHELTSQNSKKLKETKLHYAREERRKILALGHRFKDEWSVQSEKHRQDVEKVKHKARQSLDAHENRVTKLERELDREQGFAREAEQEMRELNRKLKRLQMDNIAPGASRIAIQKEKSKPVSDVVAIRNLERKVDRFRGMKLCLFPSIGCRFCCQQQLQQQHRLKQHNNNNNNKHKCTLQTTANNNKQQQTNNSSNNKQQQTTTANNNNTYNNNKQ